ncbi:MAG: trigger factor [Candidatus Portnoybacteria bacterium CG10_big_fil_rev_8_21_14_0_10_40_22]|uniref:Trigger factor n=1 Tax=Candidatus Portnoybacteria bacterium CG10_big_fil_rev_8_21_14_0_10_40_22 TaxID=1974814 RepID=A0A2M8KFN1_9BACT|nr:MAG: trigger factor [Candidatus Portnoybacteria bacterium CG10_big_fil_rev_8_21_14_0_10_40_22]
MNIEIKKLPKSEIEMEIEVPAIEWDKYLSLAVKNLGQNLEVPGFRKGQAPQQIVEREIGKDKILQEAAQLCCRKSYVHVLATKKIEAVGAPKITVLKMATGNPFVFRAQVAVVPEVVLPEYEKIARDVPKNKIKVDDKDIEETINYLRKSRAQFVTLVKPAQKGDCVKVDLWVDQTPSTEVLIKPGIDETAPNDGKKPLAGELKDQVIVLGENSLLPGLDEKLFGMKEGESKEFDLELPVNKDGHEVGGQAKIRAKMNLVQKIVLPEMNDEFAMSLGKFKDVADLNKNLRQGILVEKKTKEDERWHMAVINKIADLSQVELPEILIKREQDKMMTELESNLTALGLQLKDYFAKIQRTEAQIQESFVKQAKQRVKIGLCLRQIARQEKIKIDEKDLEAEMSKFLSQFESIDQAKNSIDLEALRLYTEGLMENRQVFALLEKAYGLKS